MYSFLGADNHKNPADSVGQVQQIVGPQPFLFFPLTVWRCVLLLTRVPYTALPRLDHAFNAMSVSGAISKDQFISSLEDLRLEGVAEDDINLVPPDSFHTARMSALSAVPRRLSTACEHLQRYVRL